MTDEVDAIRLTQGDLTAYRRTDHAANYLRRLWERKRDETVQTDYVTVTVEDLEAVYGENADTVFGSLEGPDP